MSEPEPRRILLLRLSHLGDVVHALPLFHALRGRWPETKLAWICQREFAPLLQGLPGLDELLIFDRRSGWRGVWQARRAMLDFGPDFAVDAQGNLKSACLSRLSGASRRLGLARPHWQERLGAMFMTELAGLAQGRHALHKTATLMQALGGGDTLSFELGLSPSTLDQGAQRLKEMLGTGESARWILHLGRAGDPRTWPAERFARLARELAALGSRVLILSGPSEAAVGRQLEHELATEQGVRHWSGQSSLRQLAGFLTVAAREGVGLVAGDSGPSHLAAACGVGVRFLSGPQDPDLTGPWPLVDAPDSPHRILRAAPDALAPITDLTVEDVLSLVHG